MDDPTSRPDPLTSDAALALMESAGAVRRGHFILSSGRRSALYVQCALALADTALGSRLCAALAERVAALIARLPETERPSLCVSPAMGGVIVGWETARHLGLQSIFMERPTGRFTLRRDFQIARGQRCLMIEDVITTGQSSRECIAEIEAAGGRTTATACLVDRSGGGVDLGAPLASLVSVDAPTFAPEETPPELAAIPAVKPGSRPGA